MTAPVAVGVDNGGTWIRLKGLDINGRCVWSIKKPSPTVEALPSFLRLHLKRFRGTLAALAVGSRGVWKARKRQALKQALSGLAESIVVMSDVEAAWLAAFDRNRPGIVVIAGTGSIAYGRRPDGTFFRAGGLGPAKGDEGSGYWIGQEWMKRKYLLKRRPPPAVRRIAALAPSIMAKAKSGDRVASDIIKEAQEELAILVHQLKKKLSLRGTLPLSVSGGVLENDWFRQGFQRRLRAKEIAFRFIRKTIDPAIAPLERGWPRPGV